VLSPSLTEALRRVVDETVATRAAWRPAVAAYLYEEGLAPLYAGLAAEGPVSEALVEAVWRLMLDTMGSRRFGVSSDHWRADDYPDRFFPILWLDVVPHALPAAPAAERLALAVRLFNLGEHLTGRARAVANRVAGDLARSPASLSTTLEAVVRASLEDAGVWQPAAPPPARWKGLRPVARFDLSLADPAFVPDAVEALGGRRFRVRDAVRPASVVLQVVGAELRVVEGSDEPAVPLEVSLALHGGAVVWAHKGRRRTLAALDLIAPGGVAANALGDVVVVDGASAFVRLLRVSA
jgi:hypothetical protein